MYRKKKCRYLTLDHFIISGHTVDEVLFRTHVPKQFSAPNLPELNRSQVHAVRHALQRPLSLIQGKKFVIISWQTVKYLGEGTQCPRPDLNKRFLPKPKTTTADSMKAYTPQQELKSPTLGPTT